MTFAIDSPDFSLASLQEVVICKNNNIHILLNSSFDTPILSLKSGRDTRADGLFQSENIEGDQLTPFTYNQEEIEADALDADLGIEEEEKEIHSNLKLQYVRDIVKLQSSYAVQYEVGHNYQYLQIPTLVSDDELVLGKTYTSKSPIDRILIIRQDIQRERKRLNILLMTTHRYDKVLD